MAKTRKTKPAASVTPSQFVPVEYPQFYTTTNNEDARHPMLARLASARTNENIANHLRDESAAMGEAHSIIMEQAAIYFKENKDLQAAALREIAQEIDQIGTDRMRQHIEKYISPHYGIGLIQAALEMLTPYQLDTLAKQYPAD